MSFKIKNEHGEICVENDVLARVAGIAAMDCYGVVGMAARNIKDGFVQLLKMESITKGVNLTVNENGVLIDIHIIVEYETNIPAICESLLSSVKYNVEESIGRNVSEINIFIEGVRI
jgi:uncharacterized alkaline shock family protein YloU